MLRRAIVVFTVTASLMAIPAYSSANLNSSSIGSQSLNSGTLSPASNLTSVLGICVRNVSIEVRLNWSASPSMIASGYEVVRTIGGNSVVVGTVTPRTTTSFTDGSAQFNKTYQYVVRTMRNNWRSVNSNTTTITTLGATCK